MMRARRVVGGSLSALVLVAVIAGPALAAATLTVSPPSGVPGQVLHAIGSGFSAGQQIKLQWDAGFLPETGLSDASGAFDVPFAIPSGASLGGHILRACIRGVCSQAVPFTVSVVAGTPPPVATPSPTASSPPSTEPSPPASTPPDGSSPSPVASSDVVSPPPGASASAGLVVPTVAPTALPGEPKPPGTVKVEFPWDRIGVAAVFALGILLIVVAAANEKWFKGSSGNVFDRGSQQILTAGEDAPSGGFVTNLKLRRNAEKGETSAKTPKLYEAAAKGTHAPRKSGSLVMHDAAHDAGLDAEPDMAADVDEEPASEGVKLKGKNIGDN